MELVRFIWICTYLALYLLILTNFLMVKETVTKHNIRTLNPHELGQFQAQAFETSKENRLILIHCFPNLPQILVVECIVISLQSTF